MLRYSNQGQTISKALYILQKCIFPKKRQILFYISSIASLSHAKGWIYL